MATSVACALLAGTTAFHAPASLVASSRTVQPAMEGKGQGGWGYKGFWENEGGKSDTKINSPLGARLTPVSWIPGDVSNDKAFWKDPEWQKKQDAAAEANKDKWMAGSGDTNWGDSGAPPRGVYYRDDEGSSGWKSPQ